MALLSRIVPNKQINDLCSAMQRDRSSSREAVARLAVKRRHSASICSRPRLLYGCYKVCLTQPLQLPYEILTSQLAGIPSYTFSGLKCREMIIFPRNTTTEAGGIGGLMVRVP